MKKTSGSGNSNRAVVRNAQLTGSSRTPAKKGTVKKASTTKTSSRTGRKAKKSSGPKVAVAVGAIAVVAVVCVVGYGWMNKGGISLPIGSTTTTTTVAKYQLTNADGTLVEMTEEEIRNSFVMDTFGQNTYINSVNVSGMTIDQARDSVIANQPEAPIAVDIKLNIEGDIMPIDMSSLTLESNIEEVLVSAMYYEKPSAEMTPEEVVECYERREQLKTNNNEYTTAYTLQSDGVSAIVHGMLDNLASEAVEAQVTGFNVDTLTFEYTPSSRGYFIDVDKAATDVKALLDSGVYEGTIVVDAEVTEPTFTTDMIVNEFGLISSSSSNTTANNNRNHNIRITCEKIDGLVLQPGETFIFNEFIGRRTAESGYLEAGTIQGNRIEQDYGGGICQVTSMMYQSVIKADLHSIERHPHRWPSSYATVGTDAAVDYGSQDFIFENNSDYPIALHAVYNNDEYKITVSIYGHQFADGVHIEFEGERISTNPAGVRYVANASMPVGQSSTTAGGHDGVTATSYQIWYDANGNEINRVELDRTYYDTVPAEVEVGILNPDGSLATLDTATGTVTGAQETDPSETDPSDSSDASDTVPSDSSETSETVPGETTAETSAVDPSEGTGTTESTDVTESTETTESTEPAETTEATEPAETTEATAPAETTAATEPAETTAATEPAETTEATEAPAPVETEAPAPAETEAPAPAETEAPAPAETEAPAPEEAAPEA